MSTTQNPSRLMYSKSNQAFVFTFGDQLLRMGTGPMFYRNKADAIRAALKQGLVVDKKGFVTSVDGSNGGGEELSGVKLATLRTPVGTRVKFNPNPGSYRLYSTPPEIGEEGEVTTVAHIGGRKSSMKGPGGGLLYIAWDRTGTQGVAPQDVEILSSARGAAKKKKKAPPGPASGFGKEETQDDYRKRIAWEEWAENEARAEGKQADASGHALARQSYTFSMRRKFGGGMEGADDDEITDVIFRVWKRQGGVIALFPGIDEGNGKISSYEHHGQHGGADYMGVMGLTRPAKPAEYASLKRELESPPYNYRFRVMQRRQRGGGGGLKEYEGEMESMTYGELPSKAAFVKRTEAESQYPYPMELVGEDKEVVADLLDDEGIEEFVPKHSHKLGVRVLDAEAMYRFLSGLKDKYESGEGEENDAAGNLASSILGTLGYEWV